MALEAAPAGVLYQQDLLHPLFVETPFDNILPSNFSSLENNHHHLGFDLLSDCCYGLINSHNSNINDCVWDYYSNTNTDQSPPNYYDPVVLGGVDHNDVPITSKISSCTDDDDDKQIWAGPNISSMSSPEASEPCNVAAPVVVTRPKRRRTRARKNQVDIENQRMTHIAVERNRRKQMNDYLALLRSLMPHSYVQRGDQASIVGGAINFVKELEQKLQCLSAMKRSTTVSLENKGGGSTSGTPFGEFFTFPQYSTEGRATSEGGGGDEEATTEYVGGRDSGGDSGTAVADVEVTMVETHALVKIRSKKPPKQLSKLLIGFQTLSLTILHLNLTKLDGVALYSFSVKVEDESKLCSVDEIAAAVYQLLGRIQEEANNLQC